LPRGPERLRADHHARRRARDLRRAPPATLAPPLQPTPRLSPLALMTDSSVSATRHDKLLTDFDAGSPAALARGVSIVENHRPGFEEVLGRLHPRLGRARRVGLTGPPGA